MFEVLIIATAQLAWSVACVWFGTWLERRGVDSRKHTAEGQLDCVESAIARANEATKAGV